MEAIQPHELMVGNWVLGEDGNPAKIEQIVPSLWDIEPPMPIPLTPEILEKAGWFVIEKDKKYINNERGIITVSFDELGMVMYKIGSMNFTTVHNFHQIQNLYFALTGEELKIEL